MNTKKCLIYKPGKDVRITGRADVFQSIIADGKELITEERMEGVIIVPELSNEKVYVTFKEGVEDFTDLFCYCHNLVSIPYDIFASFPRVKCFYCAFYECTLLEEIPEGLFANNSEVVNFAFAFACCKSLKQIPASLFAACPKVQVFSSAFLCCTELQEIPEGLFANSPMVVSFRSVFAGCTALRSLPAALFSECFKVKDFSNAFSGCTSLAGESPYTLIEGKKVYLWERVKHPCYFASPLLNSLFEDCVGISGYWEDDYSVEEYVPRQLIFQPGERVQLVNRAEFFESIVADGVELITETKRGKIVVTELKDPNVYVRFRRDLNDYSFAFAWCKNLKSVVVDLFDYLPNAKAFTGVFMGCSSLDSIPFALFDYCEDATTFNFAFKDCTSLTFLPHALFAENVVAQDFSYLFSGCTALTGESPYTELEGKKVHLYERYLHADCFETPKMDMAFDGCTGLSDYKEIKQHPTLPCSMIMVEER